MFFDKNKELILTVSHNLFLTHDERYNLAKGQEINITGLSLPVWINQKTNQTSEPATEVFCSYVLTNKIGDHPIEIKQDGYVINIPQMPVDYKPPKRIPDDAWRKMSEDAQVRWYDENPVPITGDSLLDIRDGGSAYLRFEEHNVSKDNEYGLVGVIHYVEIKTVESLEESLLSTVFTQ